MQYPIARKDFSYVDKFHGVELFDVYRWLEDPNADETQIFIEKQNEISRKFIEEGSDRYRIEKKLTKLWNYPKYSCPTKHGDYYYFYINTGLQNHNVLFQQKHLVDEPKAFLDPNTWSEDGTIALSQKTFSEDGNYMAYGISENGSDWLKIKIRNVKSGEDLKETLENVKFSGISWTLDNKGFFYAKYDQDECANGAEVKQNENQKLYYHYVGKQQNEDILVAEFPEEPSWRIHSQPTFIKRKLNVRRRFVNEIPSDDNGDDDDDDDEEDYVNNEHVDKHDEQKDSLCLTCYDKDREVLCLPCKPCKICRDCFKKIEESSQHKGIKVLCLFCRSIVKDSMIIYN